MKRLVALRPGEQSAICRLEASEAGLLEQPNDATLDAIYRAERPSLLRRLARQVGIDQAEDIVQQVFVRLAGRSDIIAGIETPSHYLGQAALNAAKDTARAAQRRNEQEHFSFDEATMFGSDPVPNLEARDRLVRIEIALERLKPLTRNVFLARRLDGYSYAEIAEQTGLSVRGVEKQMGRAIKQLDKHLRDA